MICPDCGEEVNKLVTRGEYKGICKRCYKRMQQNEYLNKKNGTNKPYVSILELKEKDPITYNRIMGRRSITDKVQNKKQTTKTINKTNNDNIKIIYYGKVSNDLEKAFKEAGINQDYIKYNNLPLWIDTFISLLSDDEDNFIMQCKKGEDIFNRLGAVYNHEKENLGWDDIERINEISFAEKALSELRRPTKELLDYYYCIDPIIEYLKTDKKLYNLIVDAKNKLKEKKEYHENPIFYSSVESSIVSAVNLAKSAKDSKNKIYDCTVWCYNLNGNPRKSLFRANNGILARNEVDAKLKLKQFLSEKFSSVIYNDRDITIKEVSSRKEIDELSRKECP